MHSKLNVLDNDQFSKPSNRRPAFFWEMIGVIHYYSANVYLFKAKNRDTNNSDEIRSKLAIKTLRQCH